MSPPPNGRQIEERDEFEALQEALPDLKRLDRYERRAWSQQKRAMRNFLNIKFLMEWGNVSAPRPVE
jgi:hypothetical protein